MDVIVSFVDGPLDGVTMTSDSENALERTQVEFVAKVIGGCLRDAEKREVDFAPGLSLTVPSELVMERAKRENWSKAQIDALVPRYEYKYWKHKEDDGIAEVTFRLSEVLT